MTRLRLFALLAAVAALLVVPAVAVAKIKRGYYIEVKTQTYIQTNAAATKIKSFNAPCIVNGTQSGGNVVTKGMTIKNGKFSYSGKSTLRGTSNSVIDIKITGKITKAGSLKGRVSYPGKDVGCADRNYTAKYYGVNPQG